MNSRLSKYVKTKFVRIAGDLMDNPQGLKFKLEKAAEKIYSELGRYKLLKQKNPNLKIGIAGCVAQAEGQEIIRRQPLVDLVVGPQSYHRLPKMLAGLEKGQKHER